MKTRGLFLSALMMGAVMAGCSNEEVLEDIHVEKKNGQKESYMAINIVAPDATASRAVDDGGFAVGSAEENDVKNLVLVFFDKNGNFYDAQDRNDFSWNATDSSNPEIEKSSNVVVVFENSEKPASFVALLNTGKSASAYENMTLDQIKAEISDYYITIEGTNYFVMSNSVYKNDKGDVVVAAPISDDMICSSKKAAEQNPAVAYVERIAVKLEASATASTTTTGKEVLLNGEKTVLTPTVTGIKFVYTNPKSYLLKNIYGLNEPFTNWNSPANFRSYWANSYKSSSYNIYSYNEVVAKGAESVVEYANENTTGTDTSTKLLVTATISATTDGTPVDIYKYKGYYYTEQGLKDEIAQILKRKNLTYNLGEEVGDNWAAYITVTHPHNVEQWQGVIGITSDITVSSDVKAEIEKLDKVYWWNDGRCYFYVPVEHFGGLDGVVRNHWYKIAVSSVSGLGTPVADEEDPIDPEKIEDETYYVAAQVKILKWKMVSQSVDLN